MMRLFLLPLVLVFLYACEKRSQGPVALDSPVAASDAVSTFELEPGFKIELIAAEPLIADPVAMEIDEHGALYVVENHGYPLDQSRSSKVKLLRDTDGDGVMDKSTIFADTLMMPTGVMRWKNGILVTDAPDLLYLEDRDGDDRADSVTRVLTGFALTNPQHNVNSPLYGLDNWIYLAHERGIGSEVYKELFSDVGSEIHYPARKNSIRLPRNANGRNVRLRPDSWELEMLASTTQYGHTFDVWGNHLLVNNSNHLMHAVLSAGYLDRKPGLVVARSTSSLPDHGNAAEVFPITRTPDRQLLTDVGVMTSACAITAYAGGAFGEEFNEHHTFVAEPVSNIVHADKLTPKGSTFVASRVQAEKEFLASTDMWSRPVNLYIGPDGALYIVDYYREIIEHPEWLSDDVIQSGRLYNGHDMGRIFRVSLVDAAPASWTKGLSFGSATAEQLVDKLADPNIWWRRTAQRMIVDRKPAGITSALEAMTRHERSAVGRLHALWTLEGLGALAPETISQALKDTEAGIRMNAIKLAELHLKEHPSLAQELLKLRQDDDAGVRFQLLCTLGSVDTPEAAEVRNEILFRDIADEFVQIAALSAVSSETQQLMETLLDRYTGDNPAYAMLAENLAAMMAADSDANYTHGMLRQATRETSANAWQVPVLKGIARGIPGNPSPLSSAEKALLLKAFLDHPTAGVKQACLQILKAKKITGNDGLSAAMEKARKMAADETRPERDRALAIDFLALQNSSVDVAFLKSIITSGKPLALQLAAVRTMASMPDETITDFAMANWDNLDPAIQDAALNAFMEKEMRVRRLMEALEKGKIKPTTVGWARSIRLMTQRDIGLRNRARTFFQSGEERKKVIADYQAALILSGDAANGKQVYQRACAICHQIKGGGGVPFGPDLGTIQSWPASGILSNIIDPNQSISHGFDLWNVTLRTGESLQGVITAETPTSITVRHANGIVRTLAREEVLSQKALNMSAMPVGLEKDIGHQEMADLLAFLRQGR